MASAAVDYPPASTWDDSLDEDTKDLFATLAELVGKDPREVWVAYATTLAELCTRTTSDAQFLLLKVVRTTAAEAAAGAAASASGSATGSAATALITEVCRHMMLQLKASKWWNSVMAGQSQKLESGVERLFTDIVAALLVEQSTEFIVTGPCVAVRE